MNSDYSFIRCFAAAAKFVTRVLGIRHVNRYPTITITQSKPYILSTSEYKWEFQNDALWDTILFIKNENESQKFITLGAQTVMVS